MAIYLPILTSFNPKGLKEAEKGFKDLEGAQAKAKYALGKANKYAAVAVGALAAGLGDAVKGAMEDEKAQDLLEKQIKRSTDATEKQIKGVEDYISAAGRQKGFTDDVLRPSFGNLVRATEDVEEAQGLMTIAMDIATAKGVPLETVTKTLEKAYGGNLTALQKLSPELRDMIKGGADLDTVMAELSKTFGGAAAEAANTTAGKFATMKIQMDELKEGIGASLLPVVERLLPFLQGMADWAAKNPQTFTIIAGAIGAIAISIMAINTAMALNPIGLIIIGIGALIAALAIAYTKFEGFRDIVRIVINQIASNFEFMANAFITMINVVIKGINLIKPGKDIGSLGQISLGRMGGGGGAAGGANPAGLDYKAMATGGIVRSPTFALIGEAGPEAVIPLDKMGGMGGGVTINVNGGDPNAVVQALRTYMRQNGSVPIKVSNIF